MSKVEARLRKARVMLAAAHRAESVNNHQLARKYRAQAKRMLRRAERG